MWGVARRVLCERAVARHRGLQNESFLWGRRISSAAQSSACGTESSEHGDDAVPDVITQRTGGKRPSYLTVSSVPRLAFLSDIWRAFEDLGVSECDVRPVLDVKFLKLKYLVRLPDADAYEKALTRSGTFLGTRTMRLTAATAEEFSRAEKDRFGSFLNTSVLMTGVPEEATRSDIDNFFRGYRLTARPFDIFYTEVIGQQPLALASKQTPIMRKTLDHSNESVQLERQVLARFESQEEAWRAARNTNGNFLLRHTIAVRHI